MKIMTPNGSNTTSGASLLDVLALVCLVVLVIVAAPAVRAEQLDIAELDDEHVCMVGSTVMYDIACNTNGGVDSIPGNTIVEIVEESDTVCANDLEYYVKVASVSGTVAYEGWIRKIDAGECIGPEKWLLVDADTGKSIAAYAPLKDGATIDIKYLDTNALAINMINRGYMDEVSFTHTYDGAAVAETENNLWRWGPFGTVGELFYEHDFSDELGDHTVDVVCEGGNTFTLHFTIAYGGFTAEATGAACGNGVVEFGEDCDPPSGACCESDCQFTSAATTCRAAKGVCDKEETCSGRSADCPFDDYYYADTICRASVGICDKPEYCAGAPWADCGEDKKRGETYVCRESVSVCDVAEVCDGSADTCPADELLDDGDSCDDADVCTENDVCASGECSGTDKACASTSGDDAYCNAITGTCECPSGTFPSCDTLPTCSPSCQNGGACNGGTSCDCKDGFEGSYCEECETPTDDMLTSFEADVDVYFVDQSYNMKGVMTYNWDEQRMKIVYSNGVEEILLEDGEKYEVCSETRCEHFVTPETLDYYFVPDEGCAVGAPVTVNGVTAQEYQSVVGGKFYRHWVEPTTSTIVRTYVQADSGTKDITFSNVEASAAVVEIPNEELNCPDIVCVTPVDICLGIDGSGSIDNGEWRKLTKFAGALINAFELSERGVHIAFNVFSSAIDLSEELSTDGDAMVRAIDDHYKNQGSTYIDKSITDCRQELTGANGRTGVPLIMMILTDGAATIDPESAADTAKAAGITIFGVLVGVDDALDDVVSTPIDEHTILVDDFEDLDAIVTDLASAICFAECYGDECGGIVTSKCTVPEEPDPCSFFEDCGNCTSSHEGYDCAWCKSNDFCYGYDNPLLFESCEDATGTCGDGGVDVVAAVAGATIAAIVLGVVGGIAALILYKKYAHERMVRLLRDAQLDMASNNPLYKQNEMSAANPLYEAGKGQ